MEAAALLPDDTRLERDAIAGCRIERERRGDARRDFFLFARRRGLTGANGYLRRDQGRRFRRHGRRDGASSLRHGKLRGGNDHFEGTMPHQLSIAFPALICEYCS